MKRNILIATCLSFFMLFLVSCGTTKPKYEKGFPKQNSPALTEFMSYFMMNNDGNFLYRQGDKQVYATINGKNDKQSIDYYYVEDEALEKSIEPLLKGKDPKKTFRELTVDSETTKSMMQPIDNTDTYNLPEITLKEENELRVKTKEGNHTLDLPDMLQDYHLEADDQLIINVTAVNRDAFSIDIQNTDQEDQDEFIRVYSKKDFSNTAFTSTYVENFRKHVTNGDIQAFTDIIAVSNTDNRYLPIKAGYGVWDMEENEIIPIDDQDYVSHDDNKVYLDGNEKRLSDGVQFIQSAEDYAVGNDQYDAEFEISFKKIAEELGFETSGVSIADIIYFNQDYIVLALNYKGKVVGDAGFTNVIIDLQDKKEPVAYLVDLNRH